MFKKYKLKNYDFRLVILLLIVGVLGVIIVGSANSNYQNKQIFGLCLGLVVMIIVSLIDFNYILNYYWILYIINIGLLVAVRILGTNTNGATRWISIFGIQFQPSELAKIILILFFAEFFYQHQDDLNSPKTIGLTLILFVIPWALILLQPALSASIIIAFIFCTMFFMAGLSYKIVLPVVGISIPACVTFLIVAIQGKVTFLRGYQFNRIMAWLHPDDSEYKSLAMQQTNSLSAIGSGQLWGKGLFNTDTTSVNNANYVSENHTDFIYSVIGEDLGFVGGIIIIALLFLIMVECLWVARNAKTLRGRIICVGVGTIIGFQTFVNIAVVTRVFPNTGVPLPFISYGLTALVSSFIGMGLVLNVGLQSKK